MVTYGRLKRKFANDLRDRTRSRSDFRLGEWLKAIESEVLCSYQPAVDRALLSKYIMGDTVPTKLHIGGEYGTDGSGQHIRRVQVHVAVKDNILLYSFIPIGNICGGTAHEKKCPVIQGIVDKMGFVIMVELIIG